MTTTEARFPTPPLPGPALKLLSDERLARRAATGDTTAFALIFERYHQGIYRYCRSMLNHEDASDALQSTMVAALRSLPGERRDISLKPWLYRIAHNESVSLIRRRRPSTELPADLPADGGPQKQAEIRERLGSLISDLRELPERQSGALVMRELNGIGYEEIGAAFSISAAAAKQSVYNARVALGQFAEGRAMDCESSRQARSGRDGRVVRSLKLRAHLRHCQDCATFKAAFGARRSDLSALAPPLAPAAAAALLESLIHGGSGAGGGGLLALLSGSGSKVTGGGLALKASAAVAVTLATGITGGTIAGLGESPGGAGDRAPGRSEAGSPRGAPGSRAETTGGQSRRDSPETERRGSGRDGERVGGLPLSTAETAPPGTEASPVRGTPSSEQENTRPPTIPSGPPAAGTPASGRGRQTANQYAPSDLPSATQQYLGGDSQGSLPDHSAPSAPPVTESPAPRVTPVPGN